MAINVLSMQVVYTISKALTAMIFSCHDFGFVITEIFTTDIGVISTKQQQQYVKAHLQFYIQNMRYILEICKTENIRLVQKKYHTWKLFSCPRRRNKPEV